MPPFPSLGAWWTTHLHLPGYEVGYERCPAAVGDMDEIDAGHHLEQLPGNVGGRAGAKRGHVDLAWIGLGLSDQRED